MQESQRGQTQQQKRNDNMKVLALFAVAILVILIGVGTLTIAGLHRDRQSARYPGASLVASHSNYQGLPNSFRWDDAYHTTDPFVMVYRWYSLRYDTGAEAQANAGCILLEGGQPSLVIKRQVNVLLCGTPTGQRIYVSRSTTLAH